MLHLLLEQAHVHVQQSLMKSVAIINFHYFYFDWFMPSLGFHVLF
jgi:hypothetical protein